MYNYNLDYSIERLTVRHSSTHNRSYVYCCSSWTRTTIICFKGKCPTIRRMSKQFLNVSSLYLGTCEKFPKLLNNPPYTKNYLHLYLYFPQVLHKHVCTYLSLPALRLRLLYLDKTYLLYFLQSYFITIIIYCVVAIRT